MLNLVPFRESTTIIFRVLITGFKIRASSAFSTINVPSSGSHLWKQVLLASLTFSIGRPWRKTCGCSSRYRDSQQMGSHDDRGNSRTVSQRRHLSDLSLMWPEIYRAPGRFRKSCRISVNSDDICSLKNDLYGFFFEGWHTLTRLHFKNYGAPRCKTPFTFV